MTYTLTDGPLGDAYMRAIQEDEGALRWSVALGKRIYGHGDEYDAAAATRHRGESGGLP
jgi:hypothetical protein